jgi:hypothetical protein
MFGRPRQDIISQAELRKAAEFANGRSPAVWLLRELYMLALERRVADGALIEPGLLSFHASRRIVSEKKHSGMEIASSKKTGYVEAV